jgi:hypothetical protein
MCPSNGSVTKTPRFPPQGPRRFGFPRFVGTIRALRLPASFPPGSIALTRRYHFRCTLASLPSGGACAARGHGILPFWRRLPAAGLYGGDVRASQVPEEPQVCRRPVLRPRQDRCVRPLRRTGMVPAQTTTRTPTTDFRGSITRLGTRCLRLAGWVTPPPRKTRFRPLARRFRTGLNPQGSNERFLSFDYISSSFLRLA